MLVHKWIDRVCCIALIVALILTGLFMNAEAFGIQAAEKVMGYENRLFDATKVHTIDIVMEDWDSFIDSCENEEYAVCSVMIDGEAYTNVGIRAKGNTSLSSVSQMNSERYSFKIEFDQYDTTKSYYGLDKLSLNNLIQDNTYMKDFLVYQMMNEFGVAAPLCSYVYITVNGNDWGLYLAVEGIEDAFLQRNYGNDYGELYKPDSLSFGGGRGNGMNFNFEDLDFENMDFGNSSSSIESNETIPQGNMQMPSRGSMPEGGMQMPNGGSMPEGGWQMPNGGSMPEGGWQMPSEGSTSEGNMQMPFGNNMFGGMGSSDVKLQYIDDNEDSYSNIFNNAKTDITDSDKQRLIASLKELSEGETIENVVDIEQVIRYFVVHNFVVNGDSYTGSMVHNYYLYEKDGILSMIPWDYNLAYGTFMGSDAEGSVNDPIDSPVSGGTQDRPMIDWIFAEETYKELYHEYFDTFLTTIFESGWFTELVDNTMSLIAPYVEKDKSKFCTYEEFKIGAETIKQFCLLRARSVLGQLEGSIPSTLEGQEKDNSTLIDASLISVSDMGTMGNMRGNFSESWDKSFIGSFSKTESKNSEKNAEEKQEESFVEDKSETPIKNFDGIQKDASTENSVNRGNRGELGDRQFPDGMQVPSDTGNVGDFRMEQIILLGGSVIILLLGLLIAAKWKR